MANTVLPFLLLAALASGPDDPGPGSKSFNGRGGDIIVPTPRVEHADITIDSRFEEPAWEQAALLEAFTQFDPVEGAEASQRTEVRVIVDATNIYFAIRAFDDDPEGVRATLAERDEFDRSDDYIRIILDTFNDQRRGYVFSVNPLGVQHDGIWNEGGGGMRHSYGPPVDDNPDFLWESHGEITEWGYAAEVRIPFKSLRFPQDEVQEWGLQVTRRIQRSGFESSWAPMTANVSNRLAQSGRLTDLRNLDPGMMLEINPVLTGKRLGEYDEALALLQRGDPEGDFGLNVSYGLTSNLTLDGTYNPDFSQIEADAGQIAVNERFALFFPEKRPFFLEGTEIFGMPKQLVYTRSISNPIVGTKLTGKVGSFNVGYIGAVDEPFDEGDPNVVANLLRVRKDVGGQSTIGGVYTDRTAASDNYNRVVGADARLIFARSYTLTVLGASSHTRDPDDGGFAQSGSLASVRIEKAGRTFSYNAEFEDTDTDFDAGSGFFRRVGDTQLQGRVDYNWYGPSGSLLESVSPDLNLDAYWDHDAFWAGEGLEEASARIGSRVSFRGNVTLFGSLGASMFSFDRDAYEGLYASESPLPGAALVSYYPDQDLFQGLWSGTVGLWVSKWERIRGNVRATWSDTPVFDRGLRVPVELGNSFSTELTLNLFPTRHFKMDVGFRHTRITRDLTQVEASSATIPRVQAQYQFSRAFFVRGIFEYSAQRTGDLTNGVIELPLVYCDAGGCDARRGSDENDFHLEGLVTYEPSPGTVFYVGYTRQMEEPEAFRFRDVRARADGLFIKLSYRFRM
jgi:hypothetical protein